MFCAVINYSLLSCQLSSQVKSAQSNFVKLNKLWEASFGILFDLMDDDNTGTLNLKETTELIVGLNLRRKIREVICARCSFKERRSRITGLETWHANF